MVTQRISISKEGKEYKRYNLSLNPKVVDKTKEHLKKKKVPPRQLSPLITKLLDEWNHSTELFEHMEKAMDMGIRNPDELVKYAKNKVESVEEMLKGFEKKEEGNSSS
jgi:hypothetical protein